MAKEDSPNSKRVKISEAQQYMLLAVLGAAVFLGIAISLVSHFSQQISFNTKIIMAAEESIVNYSNTIRDIGVCKGPSGDIYSDEELNSCNPNSIDVRDISGTLRAKILENLAANEALNSVPKEDSTNCLNSDNKQYTYNQLMENYRQAHSTEELQAASNRIKSCSALRVIPDALPSFKNEEALLASLNKLFILSDWEPEAIMPGGTADASENASTVANPIPVSFSMDADTGTVMKVLTNIERSIREFNFNRISIEWKGGGALDFQTQATAYYTDEANLSETDKTITPEGN